MGTYEEINATFNIKDILDSYNQSLKKGTEDDKENNTQKKFSAEDASPSKPKEEATPAKKNENVVTEANDKEAEKKKEKDKQQDLVVAEEKFEGGVTFKDYLNHFSFTVLGCGGLFLYAFISILCALLQLAPSYVLAKWTSLPLQE